MDCCLGKPKMKWGKLDKVAESQEKRIVSEMKFINLHPGFIDKYLVAPLSKSYRNQIKANGLLLHSDSVQTIETASQQVSKKESWRYSAYAAQRLVLQDKFELAKEFLDKIKLPYARVDLLFMRALINEKTKQFLEAYKNYLKIYRFSVSGNSYSQFSCKKISEVLSKLPSQEDISLKDLKWLAFRISPQNLFRDAIEKDDPYAQYHLGRCLDNGYGVKQDKTKAVYYYRQAAEQGDAKAQYNLGVCYKEGKGVKTDLKKAVHYFRKAAGQGDGDAKNQLAKLKTKGVS